MTIEAVYQGVRWTERTRLHPVCVTLVHMLFVIRQAGLYVGATAEQTRRSVCR